LFQESIKEGNEEDASPSSSGSGSNESGSNDGGDDSDGNDGENVGHEAEKVGGEDGENDGKKNGVKDAEKVDAKKAEKDAEKVEQNDDGEINSGKSSRKNSTDIDSWRTRQNHLFNDPTLPVFIKFKEDKEDEEDSNPHSIRGNSKEGINACGDDTRTLGPRSDFATNNTANTRSTNASRSSSVLRMSDTNETLHGPGINSKLSLLISDMGFKFKFMFRCYYKWYIYSAMYFCTYECAAMGIK
jgi:penicillin-binding protein 1A